jgi:outer membrane receptor protein involved in Fe transport
MNKLKLTIFFIGLFVSTSIAQQRQGQRGEKREVKITGKVIDKDSNQPLEYATIAFYSKQQNKIVTGGITDIKGNFNISVPTGMYDISIEYISFKTQTITEKRITSNENIGVFSLYIDVEALGEVEVIAEYTTVEIKLDKKIYNVGKDLTVSGGTVSDVLDNVPSVSVDVEGNVALRGNDNVRILINGKPSGLVGLNSTDALRQLPAEAIEKVEVITSPSARYDAQGTAGILNIILRRSKLQGLNGAVTTNVGYPRNAGLSGNINYRTGDFNFFNTSGYTYRESPGNSLTETNYINGTYLKEKREFERQRNSVNIYSGLEWYITDSASLTTSIIYRDNTNQNETTNTINGFETDGTQISSFRFDPEKDNSKTVEYAINFDKQYNDDSDHRLTFDFKFEKSNDDENSLITENGDEIETVRTIDKQNRILLQSDYVLPIGENSQFELGYRGTFNDLDTDYTLAFNENGVFVVDTNVSNNLIYKEYVNAVYTQYGSKIKEKFSYLLGLRVESTRVIIDQSTSGDFERKKYTGLFPTVNLGYEITEDQSITLGYNRRIRRPRSRFINPFPSRSSATNLFQGNPDIDPSYSNTLDLGYLNKIGKLILNSSIYYAHSTSVFTFISEDTGNTAIVGGNEIPVIRRTPINLSTNNRYGFEFTVTYRPTKKWNFNGNFNLFQSITRGDYKGESFDADNLSWFIRLNNKVTMPSNIDWQTIVFYRGPSEDAQNLRKGMFSTTVAFSKDLFKENASISFNISDVFNSRKRNMTSTTPTFFSESEFQWRERSFNLSFTYRFNQKKKRARNRGDFNGGEEFEGEG